MSTPENPYEFKVENIVVTLNLGRTIDLKRFCIEYQNSPEISMGKTPLQDMHTGLSFLFDSVGVNVLFLACTTGRVVITGCKTTQEAFSMHVKAAELLKQYIV